MLNLRQRQSSGDFVELTAGGERPLFSESRQSGGGLSGPGGKDPLSAKKEAIKARKFKVLFVDDQERSRRSTARWLRADFGLDVNEAGSGEAALDELRDDDSYDFIFLDLMMHPGMNGIQTYLELSKLNLRARVVMMSAYQGSPLWREAEELGFQPLSKPLTETEETLIDIFNGYESGH